MPSASFIESAPKVASRTAGRRVIEPVRESATTSDRLSEKEDDEVAVSCKDLQSSFTAEDCVRIARQYGLEVVAPYELERPQTPPNGYVTLSEIYLKFGVRFPLYPFFVEVLEYYRLTMFQVTPNG